MTVVFESEAEDQLYDLAEVIDDINISGAGSRWINKFFDFVATSNVSCAICRNERLAEMRYNCITYKGKWVIAFVIKENEMRVYEVLNGALLK